MSGPISARMAAAASLRIPGIDCRRLVLNLIGFQQLRDLLIELSHLATKVVDMVQRLANDKAVVGSEHASH